MKQCGLNPLCRSRTRRSAALPVESAPGSRFRATMWEGNVCGATETVVSLPQDELQERRKPRPLLVLDGSLA